MTGPHWVQRLRPWRTELLLLLAGVVLVALGAGSARSGSAIALLPLDAAVVAVAAATAVTTRRAPLPVRRATAAAAVLLILVAVPFARIPSGGEVTVAVAVAVGLLCVTGLRGSRPRPGAVGVIGAALLVALAVVTAVSPDRYALLRFLPFLVATVPLCLLLAGSGPGVRRRVLRFVIVLGAAEAVLAIGEPLFGSPQLWSSAKVTAAGLAKALPNPLLFDVSRSQGTLGHPLALGVLLLVAFALLLRNPVGPSRTARAGIGAVLLLGLLASGSRSSIVVAVLLALLLVPRWRIGRRAALVGGGAAVAAALVAVAAAPVLASWAASGSTTHRLGALDALPTLLGQPLVRVLVGNGWASTNRMFSLGLLQDDGLKAVDEQFVLMLSQGGLLAVVLLIAVLVLGVVRSHRSVLPAALAIAATMLVFDVLAWPSAAALVAVVLGCATTRAAADPLPVPLDQERRAYSR